MELTNFNENKDRKKRRKPAIDLSTMVYGKVPPQAKDLEEAILGAIMVDKTAFNIVQAILKPEHFYVDANQKVFSAFERLVEKRQPIDILTVVEELKTVEELDAVGGPYYVTRLTNAVVSAGNIEAHSRIILQKFLGREVIRVAGELIGDAYEDSEDSIEAVYEAINKLRETIRFLEQGYDANISNLGTKVVMDLESRIHYATTGEADPKDIRTGMRSWDDLNGRLDPGVYVVAARPGMGKSAFIAQMIMNMGFEHHVGMINGEMTNQQIVRRLATNAGHIDNYLFKKNPALITKDELTKLYHAVEKVSTVKLHMITDTEINKISNRFRFWKEEYNIKAGFIDFLQILKVSDRMQRYMTELQQLNYILEETRAISLELEMPIILLSQLNRDNMKRGGDHRPKLSDLKGSGKIEEIAYQISFLHRPDYYEGPTDAMGEDTKNLTYQIIAKFREGLMNQDLKHRFLPQYSGFTEWDTGWTPTIHHGQDYKSMAAGDDKTGFGAGVALDEAEDLPF